MKAKRIAFPDGRHVVIDGLECGAFEVVVIGVGNLFVSVRALSRVYVDGKSQIRERTVAILTDRPRLVKLAQSILRRDLVARRKRGVAGIIRGVR